MPGIASSAPAVLIAHLAAPRPRIRVGSGGVMLPNHAPLVVAEQFGMLEALHPGRIDLGIGRAPGTDQLTARALRRSTAPPAEDDFPDQLVELLGYFDGRLPEDHPYRHDHRGARARATRPPSGCSARATTAPSVAGRARPAVLLRPPLRPAAPTPRWPPTAGLPPVRRPRRALRDARRVGRVRRDRRARPASWPGSAPLSFLRLRTGRPGRLPSPEEAAAYEYTRASSRPDRTIVDGSHIVGSPDRARRPRRSWSSAPAPTS